LLYTSAHPYTFKTWCLGTEIILLLTSILECLNLETQKINEDGS